MENHEEKKGCCEGKGGGMACCHGMSNCCHNWKKCHIMRKVIMLILIIIAFCLGSRWGEMRNARWENNGFGKGGMMNWGYGKFQKDYAVPTGATGSVTVEVAKPATPAQ